MDNHRLEQSAMGFAFALIVNGNMDGGVRSVAVKAFEMARAFEDVRNEQPEFKEPEKSIYCRCEQPNLTDKNKTFCIDCNKTIPFI